MVELEYETEAAYPLPFYLILPIDPEFLIVDVINSSLSFTDSHEMDVWYNYCLLFLYSFIGPLTIGWFCLSKQ